MLLDVCGQVSYLHPSLKNVESGAAYLSVNVTVACLYSGSKDVSQVSLICGFWPVSLHATHARGPYSPYNHLEFLKVYMQQTR